MSLKHPAKFSKEIMPVLAEAVKGCTLILDPFAGTGRVHDLGVPSVGVELEPEWAGMHPQTIVGNALALPFPDETFDGICTSPCYGNRMADHHNARDDSKRNTYRHVLGRPLSADSAAGLQWGQQYRDFHTAAWREALRVLKPSGRFVLNISDHIRKGERQRVSDWHLRCLLLLDLTIIRIEPIVTRRQRQGANGDLRTAHEFVFVLEKP